FGIVGGVGIYSFLPLRAMMHPPLNYFDPETWVGFRTLVFSGGGYLTSYGISGFASNLPQIIGWYAEWFTPTGRALVAVLAFAGLIALAIRSWPLAPALVVGIVLPIYEATAVPNMERARYFLMPNWVLLLAAIV